MRAVKNFLTLRMAKEPDAIERRPTLAELLDIPGWDAYARENRERLRNYTGEKGRDRIPWDIVGPFLWRARSRGAPIDLARELASVRRERDELRRKLDEVYTSVDRTRRRAAAPEAERAAGQ